ncbi:hypothetical protein PVL29_021105 [Vitis rotundifolia]|uniref:Neprosin PEP catalytic domain-containing protein n=1 Tax=Vitis rotundifolia TaxID=103349 RepID=A0AA39DBN3_VITRO|nr:hypothetical protein PVL29_021105 [Vitis rotundifolia]
MGRSTLKDVDGSILDCIDINKQPAFDHPLLKDHKIQMKPSSLPKEIPNIRDSILQPPMPKTQEKCPEGTVLIRRTRKEDLVAAKAVSNHYRANANAHPSTSKYFGFHFQLVKTAPDTTKGYYGAAAKINIRNVKVSENQFSEASIWIQNSLEQTNNIQFGWTINPKLFGDNHTRSFTYWTADNYRTTGCFNSLCPGFVQISRENYLGQILPISEYGGDMQYMLDILIFKDPKSGNWWMAHETKHGRKEFIGYWPKSIFTTMADSASEIQFGGKAYSPLNQPAPPMGSGHFDANDFSRTCFISNMQLVDSSNILFEPKNTSLLEITDNPNPDCYQVAYKGYTGEPRRYAMLFGGPGGTACDA